MDPIQNPLPPQSIPPQPPASHGTPMLRIIALLAFALIIVVLSSLGAYWYLNNQAQKQITEKDMTQMISPTVIPTTATSSSASESQEALDEISKLEKPNKVKIDNAVGNFALGSLTEMVGEIEASGAQAIWMKTGNIWKRLDLTQFAFSCKTLLENKAPPTLLQSSSPQAVNDQQCTFYEDQGDCTGYEQECARLTDDNPYFNYKDLYSEKYNSQ